jgi:acetoin utilization deacetylase AcuC-like enzyme
MGTGFCWHELFAWHDAGRLNAPFIEPLDALDHPETKRRFRNLLEASGLLARLTPIAAREATDEEICRVHSLEHLGRVRGVSDNGEGGMLGRMAHIGPHGLAIAKLAAGAAIATVDAVLDGHVQNAYALVRPAGHHAKRDVARGYCIFNNVAIAARHALEARGLSRIAVIDWDVHWGDGLQEIFWDDPRVLTISLHQDELLNSLGGTVSECGGANAVATTLNLPLPPGCGHGAYLEAFRQVVLPALRRYRPELIIVASGLDALANDSYGRMNLHSDSFRNLTQMLMEAADQLCAGRLVLCHEGGYSALAVPFAGLAIMEALSGLESGVRDPFLANLQRQSAQRLAPHQQDAIAAAARNIALVPMPPGEPG